MSESFSSGPPTLWDAFPSPGRPGTARDGAGSTPNYFLPRMFNLRRIEHQVCAAAHMRRRRAENFRTSEESSVDLFLEASGTFEA